MSQGQQATKDRGQRERHQKPSVFGTLKQYLSSRADSISYEGLSEDIFGTRFDYLDTLVFDLRPLKLDSAAHGNIRSFDPIGIACESEGTISTAGVTVDPFQSFKAAQRESWTHFAPLEAFTTIVAPYLATCSAPSPSRKLTRHLRGWPTERACIHIRPVFATSRSRILRSLGQKRGFFDPAH